MTRSLSVAEYQAKNAQLAQQLAEANAEIKALRGILGADFVVLDSEIDDMIYDWMEAEDEVPSDDKGN